MSQQHYAVTGVSRGIGAEIAIGASVSRLPSCGFDVGQPSVAPDRFRGIVRDHGCRALGGVGLLPLSSCATSPTSSRNLAARCSERRSSVSPNSCASKVG